ncbi:MAG: hypothetical protein IJF01_07435 [Tidjanibacter sp.]|nr:hypothetical protein [Tidjanibacter sp.]
MARVYNRSIVPRDRNMSLTEVANYADKSRRTIYRYISNGLLKPKYVRRPTGTLAMCFLESEVKQLFEPLSAREAISSGSAAFK